MLGEMIKLRTQLAKSIEEVCKNGGGSGGGSNDELEKVKNENSAPLYV